MFSKKKSRNNMIARTQKRRWAEIWRIWWEEPYPGAVIIQVIITIISGAIVYHGLGNPPWWIAVIGGIFILTGITSICLFAKNLWKAIVLSIRRKEIEKIFDRSSFRIVKKDEVNAKENLKFLFSSVLIEPGDETKELVGIGRFTTSPSDELFISLEEIDEMRRKNSISITIFISKSETSEDYIEKLEELFGNIEIRILSGKPNLYQLFFFPWYLFIVTSEYAIRIKLDRGNIVRQIEPQLNQSSIKLGKWPDYLNYMLNVHNSLSLNLIEKINENGVILGADKPLLWYQELPDLFTKIGETQNEMNRRFEELSNQLLNDAEKITTNIPILQGTQEVKTQSIKDEVVINWLDKLKRTAEGKQEEGVEEFVERYIYVTGRKCSRPVVRQNFPGAVNNIPFCSIWLPNDTEYINYLKSDKALQNSVFKSLPGNYRVWIVLAKDERIEDLKSDERNPMVSDWIIFKSGNYELLQYSLFIKTQRDDLPLFVYNYKYAPLNQGDEQFSLYRGYRVTLSSFSQKYLNAKGTEGDEVDIATDIPLIPLETFIQILENIDTVAIYRSNSDILIDPSKLYENNSKLK